MGYEPTTLRIETSSPTTWPVAVNKIVEDSTTADSTTPILLILCASIGFTAACRRSSRFLPSTSFHLNSVDCQIKGISFCPNSTNKHTIQAFLKSFMISLIQPTRQQSFNSRITKRHLPSPAQSHLPCLAGSHPLHLAISPPQSLAKCQPSLVKSHLPSPAIRYLPNLARSFPFNEPNAL